MALEDEGYVYVRERRSEKFIQKGSLNIRNFIIGTELFVGHIPERVKLSEFFYECCKFGKVEEARLMLQGWSGSKIGFVRYFSKEIAERACVQFDRLEILPEHFVHVKKSLEKPEVIIRGWSGSKDSLKKKIDQMMTVDISICEAEKFLGVQCYSIRFEYHHDAANFKDVVKRSKEKIFDESVSVKWIKRDEVPRKRRKILTHEQIINCVDYLHHIAVSSLKDTGLDPITESDIVSYLMQFYEIDFTDYFKYLNHSALPEVLGCQEGLFYIFTSISPPSRSSTQQVSADVRYKEVLNDIIHDLDKNIEFLEAQKKKVLNFRDQFKD